ncbi:aldo/keto reductase [Halorussus limi]|uniref:Aldo/keto reductase n=1 Tax=Halorussus limi TaxID=2938695 RepID=A0A8U0HQK2_9EURY|nr:aldo/keto reductase [Halorussus limi]UPV73352.1 aldo/keto reductase [Halorussus limi]
MTETLPDIGIGTYEITDPETCAASVETALNCGYRHVDTAEMYDNEVAVGEGIAAADADRDDVFVSTKIHSRNLGYDDVLEHARGCCDRLGVDSLDLLYVHWPIRTYDPDETLAAFDRLHDEGVIRHVGLSNFTPDLLEDALDRLDAPLFAHQVECHPLLQQAELRSLARERGHTLVAYSPLAKGTVTEVPELVAVADERDATPAQVSLAWLLSKENVAVIPKASSEAHVRENFEARKLDLTDDEVARIDAIEREARQVDFEAAPWN